MNMPHFVIHSSVDGHLGWFHFGAIMNNTAKNIHIHVFVCNLFSILLGIYLGAELLDHRVILFKLFEELPNCFPQWLPDITFSLSWYEDSNYFISLPILFIFFAYGHRNEYEVVAYCGFDLHFPIE
jgi:hypothetical protein